MPNTILETLEELDALTKGRALPWSTQENPAEITSGDRTIWSKDTEPWNDDLEFLEKLVNSYATISETLRRALAVVEDLKGMYGTNPEGCAKTICKTGEHCSSCIKADEAGWWYSQRTAILRKHGFGESNE